MNIPNISGLVRVGKTFIMANRPEILFGASVTATLASVALAAKGGYDARGIVDQYEIENAVTTTVKEKIQLTWLCYMPAATTTIGALGATTGLHIAHIQDKKQLTAMAIAAIDEVKTSAQDYVADYKAAVAENATPKTKAKIEESFNEKSAAREIQNTDHTLEELYLVRDGRSGRDIWSNQARIEAAINHVNKYIIENGDAELNEFYGAAGFELLYPEGDDWGWSGDVVDLSWKTDTKDDGRPVRRFDFRISPKKS